MEEHCNLCDHEANWGMEVRLRTFLTEALDEGQRFASCTVEEIDSGNIWTGVWLRPRSGPNIAEKEVSITWFQTFAVLWMSYSFFLGDPRL